MPAHSQLDFGYPWWLSYGHLPILAVAAIVFVAGYAGKWPKWLLFLSALIAAWAGSAFVIDRFVLDINTAPGLPTQEFLRSGAGRVLDIGAGTGRSSIMVLTARPQATLVALDLFGESFEQHFGKSETPQQKLMANLRAAGVEQRASIETADMRKLPFENASFDAIVSAYAVDHLNRQGSDQALAEAARVIKPGGDFLLMVTESEPWSTFMFGPLLKHGSRGADWWISHVKHAGFEIVEKGTSPITLYMLARRS